MVSVGWKGQVRVYGQLSNVVHLSVRYERCPGKPNSNPKQREKYGTKNNKLWLL